MVTLGEDIVMVGGGPDNYGSTQVNPLVFHILFAEEDTELIQNGLF